jgi:hypothetical protein
MAFFVMGDSKPLRERVARLLTLALQARQDGQIGVSEIILAEALRIDDQAEKLDEDHKPLPSREVPHVRAAGRSGGGLRLKLRN